MPIDEQDDERESISRYDPPTASKFKIPTDRQQPPRAVKPAPTSAPAPIAPTSSGPSRGSLIVFFTLVTALTGFAMWTTLREPKKEPRAAPSTAAPPPSETPITISCRCFNDLSRDVPARAQCLRELIESTSVESTTCLRAFLNDARTEKALKEVRAESPTPEQALLLDAANALPEKLKQANLPPPPKPSAAGTPQYPSPPKAP